MKFDIELLAALNEEYKNKPVQKSYPQYNDNFQFDAAEKRIQNISKLIDFNNKSAMEIGCGRGHFSRALSDKFQCNVTGIDLYSYKQWKSLENDKVHFRAMDLSDGKSSFKAGIFDIIFSHAVFEHIEHPFSMLKELKRLIKPNGYIYIYANQYRSAIGSHLYRKIFFPFPHLLFQPDVIFEYLGTPQGKYLLNKLTYSHYKNYFDILGLDIIRERFVRRKIDEEFYERFGSVLKMYPRFDLELDFFEVVLTPKKEQKNGLNLKLQNALEAEKKAKKQLQDLKKSVPYQLGMVLQDSTRSPRDFLAFPFRIIRILSGYWRKRKSQPQDVNLTK